MNDLSQLLVPVYMEGEMNCLSEICIYTTVGNQ